MALVVYCADIGSVMRGNFGWARLACDVATEPCTTGQDIAEFADLIAADLNAGANVALGFECPLFVPVPEDPRLLTSARPGEGDRAWCAGAGAGALATGLTETAWILDRVRTRTSRQVDAFHDWGAFCKTNGGLFVWEAFVTKKAKADTHHGDAELAVLSFRDRLREAGPANDVVCSTPVRSLIGAVLLQAGWTTDLKWLGRACAVVRVEPKSTPEV